MNLLETLGVTPMGAVLWAAAGLLAACAWGALSFVRRSRGESRVGLGLEGSGTRANALAILAVSGVAERAQDQEIERPLQQAGAFGSASGRHPTQS